MKSTCRRAWLRWPTNSPPYGLPMGCTTNHLHVWKSLLETAGFKLADIPREWDAFWAFWCDEVQSAVRLATGRDDIWGIGLPMSGQAFDTSFQLHQFLSAYEADYVSPDGHLVIDNPEIRRRLIKAIDSYTAVYRKGCTPPSSLTWGNPGNNEAVSCSAGRDDAERDALDSERAQARASGRLLREHSHDRMASWSVRPVLYDPGHRIAGRGLQGRRQRRHGQEFVRFLVAEGWLTHYLNFSGERMLPSISKLLDQPFWLDPSDPHRMASAMQVSSRPLTQTSVPSGNWRHVRVDSENVWGKAVHRVAADGITPEQAVDEAIARSSSS